MNVLPLGSGAIAGNPFEIDRQFLATDLGFKGVSFNSMYAVSDRDFVGMIFFFLFKYFFLSFFFYFRIHYAHNDNVTE